MAAKLQSMGYNAHFYEPAAGGHGYGKDNTEVATLASLGIAFLQHHTEVAGFVETVFRPR